MIPIIPHLRGDYAECPSQSISNYSPWYKIKKTDTQSNNTTFNELWGNLGSVRAHDPVNNRLYFLMGKQRSQQIHLGTIDIQTGSLMSPTPPPLNGDTGFSGEILMQLALLRG